MADGTITWELAGPLFAEDGPQTITYTARIKSSMPMGTTNIRNVVVITHPDDENPDNDRDEHTVTVVVVAEPFLPFTGGDLAQLLAFAFVAILAGSALRRTATVRARR